MIDVIACPKDRLLTQAGMMFSLFAPARQTDRGSINWVEGRPGAGSPGHGQHDEQHQHKKTVHGRLPLYGVMGSIAGATPRH
jgi:hypothetical protein